MNTHCLNLTTKKYDRPNVDYFFLGEHNKISVSFDYEILVCLVGFSFIFVSVIFNYISVIFLQCSKFKFTIV